MDGWMEGWIDGILDEKMNGLVGRLRGMCVNFKSRNWFDAWPG